MTLPREIKFRGKWIAGGEWMHGNLIGNDVIVGNIVEFEDEYFNTEFWYKVVPETVGQYTGLKDKNGKEIYEGDLFRTADADEVYIDIVVWSEKDGSWEFENTQGHCAVLANDINLSNGEVIGNIHDNPELLEG